jgi:hypothetical protein
LLWINQPEAVNCLSIVSRAICSGFWFIIFLDYFFWYFRKVSGWLILVSQKEAY